MTTTIDMKTMRYINLFTRIAHVQTTHCFMYNGHIVFAVPQDKVSLAIGKGASHVRQLREITGKRIKVVTMPDKESNEGIVKFIEEVVNPIDCGKIEIHDDTAVINAPRQSKAALIGRNRVREKELSDVLKSFFQIAKLRIA